MPVFQIQHTTTYEYNRLVKESLNQIRIHPVQSQEQEILRHDLQISGNPEVHLFSDYWGNKTGIFNLLPPHKEMVISSNLLIRTTQSGQIKINFHSGFDELHAATDNRLDMLELLQPSKIKSQQQVLELIKTVPVRNHSVAGTVEAVCEYIFKHFKYEKGITTVETTIDEILEIHSGVCQDFVHLMLQLLRTMRIPSRYVSGYICPNKDGMRGEGATHAWVEAWIPGYGWAGIDPTNNVWVTNKHVKLAVGRNFNDCSPVKGSFKGPAQQRLSVYVSIGYEDGHSFEDKNHVRLDLSESGPDVQEEYAPEAQQQ